MDVYHLPQVRSVNPEIFIRYVIQYKDSSPFFMLSLDLQKDTYEEYRS